MPLHVVSFHAHLLRTVLFQPVPLQSVPLFVVALLAGGFLVGLALFGAGVLSLWRWRVLSADEANQYRGRLDGPIEAEGPARPTEDGDSFIAAVSRTPCLVCEIEAQRYQSSQHGGSWHTVESRTTTRPFVVESPVGEIRVEPEGANLVLEKEVVASLGRTDEATGDTKAFFDAVGVNRRSGSIDIGVADVGYGSKYRVREARVDVDESVYVAGEALTDDPMLGGYAGPDAVIRAQHDRSLVGRLFGFPFLVGDGGERAVRRHFRNRGLLLAGLGLLVTVGLGLLTVSAV
jgi:hypothetical protein